jgi:hypothetical protein
VARFSLITFIKGWWKLDIENKWHWMPLPSQVIKIGKTMTDPVISTSVTRRGGKVRFDIEEATAQVAYSVFQSHANIDREYPVLGGFINVMRRLGRVPHTMSDLTELPGEKHHRIHFGKFAALDQHMLCEDYQDRYGLVSSDFERLEKLYDEVHTLPCLLIDPVFDRLCDTDYGSDITAETAPLPMSLYSACSGPAIKNLTGFKVANSRENEEPETKMLRQRIARHIANEIRQRAAAFGRSNNARAAATLALGAPAAYAYKKAEQAASDTFFKKRGVSVPHSSVANTKLSGKEFAPVAMGSKIVSRRPVIKRSAAGGQRIHNRELVVSTVTGASTFSITNTFNVQPGLAALMPWGSTIAQQYEQYTIHSMKFIWVPFISTATPGTILMMVDYNASDPAPTTEAQFMDHAGAVTASAWETVEMQVKPSMMGALGKKKYVRPCAVAGDIKTFDSGIFYLAVDNGTAVSWGKLYVEYDIELFIPQLSPATYLKPVITSWYANTTAPFSATTTATPLRINMDPLTYDALGWNTNVTAHIFTPPAGFYRVQINLGITDTSAETLTTSLTMQKNLVVYPGTGGTFVQSQAVVANGGYNLAGDWLISCNGTDTVGFFVTVTGAAGTLAISTLNLAISLA